MSEHDDLSGGSDGIDRRRFIRGAATVAWATPLILSMSTAGSRALAVSNPVCGDTPGSGNAAVLNNCPCLDSTDCVSDCCCGGGTGPLQGTVVCVSSATCASFMGDCV